MDSIQAITKQITVNRPPEEAFKIWVEGLGSWWPFEGHSIGDERAVGAVFEPKLGGRVYEVWDDGQQRDWAEVIAYDPPNRFVLAWHPNPNRPAPTEVEIRFVAEGTGTRLELEHRGWERLGAEGAEVRDSYAGGWPTTLARFEEAAA